MKKVLAVVLALALTLSMVGMAMAEGKIGVSMPTQSLQRWNQDGANLKAKLEAAGFTVDLQYANNEVATQVSQLEKHDHPGRAGPHHRRHRRHNAWQRSDDRQGFQDLGYRLTLR